MKLRKLAIHNFRGILETAIDIHDYSILVGANNAGKSTVIDALRAFYEKDGFKFKPGQDFPFLETTDKESWIDLTFVLTDEEVASLADEYRLPQNQLRVRKYFQTELKTHEAKPAAGSTFGYKKDGSISNEQFYGAKNVQNGKFGEIVYIPAISKLDDHAKLSGPSVLRDLLTNVLEDVVSSSEKYKDFSNDFETFAKGIKTEETQDKRSLVGLEKELNNILRGWDTEFSLAFSTPSISEIIKSMLDYEFVDQFHKKPQSAGQFGSGFQRHFIYSLIDVGSRYVGKKVAKKSKDFSPSFTLILFEEPEAFLHPPQQAALSRSLETLAATPERQVFCSTHSPQFVSKNVSNLTSIIRMRREKGQMDAFQLDDDKLKSISELNQVLNKIAERWSDLAKNLTDADRKNEMEALKYCLWLNPDRCNMFFSNHVLLVEGHTEQALINRLIAENKISHNAGGLYVLDCLGKYNVHRFMNLLSALGIHHSVLHDTDNNEKYHKELGELILSSKNETLTLNIKTVSGNLETALGIKLECRPSAKPQHVLFLYQNGNIKQENLDAFCSLVSECVLKPQLEPASIN